MKRCYRLMLSDTAAGCSCYLFVCLTCRLVGEVEGQRLIARDGDSLHSRQINVVIGRVCWGAVWGCRMDRYENEYLEMELSVSVRLRLIVNRLIQCHSTLPRLILSFVL